MPHERLQIRWPRDDGSRNLWHQLTRRSIDRSVKHLDLARREHGPI